MADPDADPGDPGLRFDGLRAVVTGAGRGLGRVYAESLAQRGASVLVNDIGVSADADMYAALDGDAAIFGADARVADVAARVADLIRQTGATAAASTADISRPDGARTLVETAVTDLGGIDIVINNAGVIPYAPIDQTTYEQFNQTIAVHVGGAFNVTKEAWPLLCASGNARILNICSIEGVLVGTAGLTAYSAAKGAMWGLTLSTAVEGESVSIRANALLPGATTRANVAIRPSAASQLAQRSPDMTAAAALWLVHPSCEINGRCYATDAGNVRAVYPSASRGYTSLDPLHLTIDELRQHWAEVEDRLGAISPNGMAEYNQFRQDARAGDRTEAGARTTRGRDEEQT